MLQKNFFLPEYEYYNNVNNQFIYCVSMNCWDQFTIQTKLHDNYAIK